MTNTKLSREINELAAKCAKSHPHTSVHLSVVGNALALGPQVVQAVSSLLRPAAESMAAAHESVKISQIVIEDGNNQKPKQ